PEGRANEHFVGEPVPANWGETLGVLPATRQEEAPPFSPEEVYAISLLAACAAPTLSALHLHERILNCLPERGHSLANTFPIFRREALEHHTRSLTGEGRPLCTLPNWLRRTHWVITIVLIAGLVFATLAKIN